jgi:GxxExxY protein
MAEEVFVCLGAGHSESIYHNAMKIQLQDNMLPFESERDLTISFKGRYVGTVRADIVVNSEVVIEFKVATNPKKDDDAISQCLTYMRLTNIKRGIVIIFPKRAGDSMIFYPFVDPKANDCDMDKEDDEDEDEDNYDFDHAKPIAIVRPKFQFKK